MTLERFETTSEDMTTKGMPGEGASSEVVLWESFDVFVGETVRGVMFTVYHDVTSYSGVVPGCCDGNVHRLRVECDDPGCCPDEALFSGEHAWEQACTQMQDVIDYLTWK